MLNTGDLGVPRDWGFRRPPSERRGTRAGRGISERQQCRGESVVSPGLRAARAVGAFGGDTLCTGMREGGQVSSRPGKVGRARGSSGLRPAVEVGRCPGDHGSVRAATGGVGAVTGGRSADI